MSDFVSRETFSHKPDWIRAWLPDDAEKQISWIGEHTKTASEIGFRIVATSQRIKLEIGHECEIAHMLFVRDTGLHVSRFDIALDIRASINFSIARKVLGKSGRWSTGKGGEMVETLYSGSRTSPRFFRVYDKASEQNAPPPWWRIELEAKGRAAQMYFDEYLLKPDLVVSDILRRTHAAAWAPTPNPDSWSVEIPRPRSDDPFRAVGRFRRSITKCLRADPVKLYDMLDAWREK